MEVSAKKLTAMGNGLNSVVVVDGRIVGSWKRTFHMDTVMIETKILTPLTKVQNRAVLAAASRYATFLGLKYGRQMSHVSS